MVGSCRSGNCNRSFSGVEVVVVFVVEEVVAEEN